MTVLWVALGAALGAPLRFWLGSRFDHSWHVGTLLANSAGSFLLGASVGWSLTGSAEALVAAGFCGGLTTYSSFAVQARDLPRPRAAAYVVLTVTLGLAAAMVGFLVGR